MVKAKTRITLSLAMIIILVLTVCLSACSNSNDTENTPVNYTVTFDSMGGSPVASQTVISGNPVRRPDTPTKEGYFLTGWYKESTLENEWNFNTDIVRSDITLYASWREGNIEEPTESLVYKQVGETYTVTDMDEETLIVIPSKYNGLPVTSIQGEYGTGAFARSAVEYAVISDSIIEIGQNTFNNCSELATVLISENSNLTTIGNNAFSGCGKLENFYLPSKAITLGDSVFNNCGSIKAFYGCC